jgi:phosphatidylglycerol---prolipoprotein diacylglyceryl transferase
MIAFFPSRPVALEIFGFSIHWYGVMYLLAFTIAAILLPHLQRERKLFLTRDDWFSLLSWGVLGVILGGRLGYVFFYEPARFALHPQEIIAVWEGGMSFHGGLLGVVIALCWACWRKKISILRVADTVMVPAAIGLALGRFGNFINQELYGTVTDLPWAIAVPGAEGLRHPSQLYSMSLDLLNAAVCCMHLRCTREGTPGRTFALFLAFYGVSRIAVEFVRAQQYPPAHLLGLTLTRGQLLTLPVFLAGVLLWLWLRPDGEPSDNR